MKRHVLGPSELILNPDGSVYHLHLLPQEVAPTIITVGDPERVDQVTQHFDEIEVIKSHREFVTHTGTYKGKRLTVVSTGIGTDNVDIVMHELDALFNIDLKERVPLKKHTSLNFIRLGTSGALQTDIELGTWLLSESAFGFDGLLHFYSPIETSQTEAHRLQEELGGLPLSYFTKGSEELASAFPESKYMRGTTLTMPGFYAPQGRALRIENPTADRFSHFNQFRLQNGKPITNLEMETAGIYGLAEVLGHRAVSISALLANRFNGEFHNNPGKVVEDMIEDALEIILQL